MADLEKPRFQPVSGGKIDRIGLLPRAVKGWSVTPSSAAQDWTVQNNIIVAQASKTPSYLVYQKADLENFELKLDYRFPSKGNSGISIRARKDPTQTRLFQSYHADLGHHGIGKNILGAWDFHTPGRREHACPRGQNLNIDPNDQPTLKPIAHPLTLADIKQADWNHVHIIARDNHFQFHINGKLASEFTEQLNKERRLTKGLILLQLHDPNMIVHFKNLKLKILN